MSVGSIPTMTCDFLSEELAVINVIPDGEAYYDYVVKNVELDRSNPKNSHFMYAKGKVDSVDLTKPCLFTEAASSLPDIDTDFPTDKREDAISYVRAKYGADKVCQIATFGRLQGRSALKAILRVEGGHSFDIMNKLTEFIPDEAAISDQLEEMEVKSIIGWALEHNAEKLKDFVYLEDGELKGEFAEVFKKAMKLEGTFQSQGKHAAGIIISSEVISDICPMAMSKSGELIAALDMGDLEKVGLPKFDFLGVDILNKISAVLGTKIIDVPLDDPEVWDLVCEGRTKGCFQIESYLGRHWSKELHPECMEDMSALISVVRPGCLNSRVADGRSITKVFCDRKNRKEELDPNEPLSKLISNTQNCIIYQETLIIIANQVAGFTMPEALKLMKGVGKKDAKLIASLKEKFLGGCARMKVVSDEQATAIFEQIKSCARYLFNKCITPDTLVELIDGSYVSIDELEIGTKIKTPNGYSSVVEKYENGEMEVVEIIMESGKEISCTIDHKFLCEDGSIRPVWQIIQEKHKIICDWE